MTRRALWRCWAVRWLYAAAVAHLLVGLALPWCADAAFLQPYHQLIEHFFWDGPAPAAAHAQQLWWMALFGATLQTVGLWMLVLIRQAERRQDAVLWGWLLGGLLLWAPQDMLISASARVWPNLLVDVLALLTMVPVLALLIVLDRAPPAPAVMAG